MKLLYKLPCFKKLRAENEILKRKNIANKSIIDSLEKELLALKTKRKPGRPKKSK